MRAPARRRVATTLLAGVLALAAAGCSDTTPDPAATSQASRSEQTNAPSPPDAERRVGSGTGGGSAAMSGPAPVPAATSPLRVVDAWATPSRDGRARIYLRLMNPGFSSVEVTGVSTDVGGPAELRASQDTTTATATTSLPLVIEAGQSVTLGPDGPFVLLTQLPRPLAAGDRVVVTLTTGNGETTRFSAFAQTAPPGS